MKLTFTSPNVKLWKDSDLKFLTGLLMLISVIALVVFIATMPPLTPVGVIILLLILIWRK